MPSLAHTVSCLARTVPKPFPLPYSQYLSLLEFCLAFPVYSRLNSSRGVPADEASCIGLKNRLNNFTKHEVCWKAIQFSNMKPMMLVRSLCWVKKYPSD